MKEGGLKYVIKKWAQVNWEDILDDGITYVEE
jgi:hypothetical protein